MHFVSEPSDMKSLLSCCDSLLMGDTQRQLPQSPTEVSDLTLFLISLIRTIKRFTGQMDWNPAGCSVCPGGLLRWWWDVCEYWTELHQLNGGTLVPSGGHTRTMGCVFWLTVLVIGRSGGVRSQERKFKDTYF